MALLETVTLVFVLLSSAAEAAPNVVLIVGDDMGWNDFSFMGSKVVQTPHIDRLANGGATFVHGYVPTSLCRASLATLLTGLYAHQHKICCNDPPEGVDRTTMHPFIQNAPALPRFLARAGYESFQTGKFWEGHYSNAGFTQGMTTKGRHGDDGLAIGRKTMQPISDFLDSCNGKQFFLWYAPMLPHQPHDPPERLLTKYASKANDPNLARYWAMCEWFDETVGELVGMLERKRLGESTLVVFVIDNGWIQRTNGEPDERQPFAPKSKRSPYDGGVRTPILLSWPGHITPRRYQELVSTIDIVPTILSTCGIEPSKEMPGENLLDLIIQQKPLRRDAVFGEIFVHTCVDIHDPGVNLTHRWVRQGEWKLIVPVTEKSVELYNLARDPFEMENVAEKEMARVSQLISRVDTWWSASAR